MRHITIKQKHWGLVRFLLCLLSLGFLITGCGFKAASDAGTTANQGTLHGTVSASPTCPLERPDEGCGARPLSGLQVQVETLGGKVIATTKTDRQGQFSVRLAPGHYLVLLHPLRYSLQKAVTILTDQMSTMTFVVDTGIR